MRTFLRLAFVAVCALPIAACFEPTEPICAYSCGPAPDYDCPHDYLCNQSDNYCHKIGYADVSCEFSDAAAPDQAVATEPDLGPDGGDHPDASPNKDGDSATD